MCKKRIYPAILAISLMSVFSLAAQVKGIEASFVQTGTVNGKVVSGEGTIYYAGPTSLALRYSTPEGEAFVIDNDEIYVAKGGKERFFNAQKNAPMRTLSRTLMNCIEGDIDAVAADNDADIITSDGSKTRKVTVKARKRSARGYEVIELRYRKSDGMVEYIKLVEFNGNVNEYIVGISKKNVNLPADAFGIPDKKERKNGKS